MYITTAANAILLTESTMQNPLLTRKKKMQLYFLDIRLGDLISSCAVGILEYYLILQEMFSSIKV